MEIPLNRSQPRPAWTFGMKEPPVNSATSLMNDHEPPDRKLLELATSRARARMDRWRRAARAAECVACDGQALDEKMLIS
jgi:hypothetical protein